MVYLNYNNLDAATQQQLLATSKEEVENKFGEDLKTYAQEHHLDYDTVLQEEAIRNLYNYQFIFNI